MTTAANNGISSKIEVPPCARTTTPAGIKIMTPPIANITHMIRIAVTTWDGFGMMAP